MAANRKLIVEIVGDSSSLSRAFHRADHEGRGFARSFARLGSVVKGGLFAGAAAGVASLAVVLHEGSKEFREHQDVAAQTNAVLKSTGRVAGISAEGVEKLALQLSNLSGSSDEAIQSAENMLLSFTNIRNQVGKGNKIFDRATLAVLNFAKRTGRDVPQAATLLGKALEDPATKVGILARAGIVFTTAQKKMLKALVESGKGLKAQKIILEELAKRFGGAAAAAGKTFGGQLGILHERFKDLAGEIVGGVFPALQKGLTAVTDFVRRLSEAKGFHAKLNIIWDGAESAARSLLDLVERGVSALTLHPVLQIAFDKIESATKSISKALGRAIAGVDWNSIWAQARGIADGLQAQLEKVDFGFVGDRIGKAIQGAVAVAIPAAKDLTVRLNKAIKAIDFSGLGRRLGPELATALVSAFVTLTDPAFWVRNWDLALAVAINALTLVAPEVFGVSKIAALFAKPFTKLGGEVALRFSGAFVEGMNRLPGLLARSLIRLTSFVAGQLGRLVEVVGKKFASLGAVTRFVIKVFGTAAAIRAVVDFGRRVVNVFKSLPGTVARFFGRMWDNIEKRALSAAIKIIEPFTHLPKILGGGTFQKLQAGWKTTLAQMEADTSASAKKIQHSINGIKGKKVKIVVATVTDGSHGPAEPGQGTTSTQAAAAAQAQAAQTAANAQKIAAANALAAKAAKAAAAKAAKDKKDAIDAFGKLMESLSLKLEVAQTTSTFADDKRVYSQIIRGIQAEIKLEGRTTDLARQLFEARRDRNEAIKSHKQSNQFKALGLAADGGVKVPSGGTLKNRATSLEKAIGGTFLDTPKTHAKLRRIARVLSGQFGKVGADVRNAIKGMLDEIQSALNGGKSGEQKGPLTKFSVANFSNISKQFTSLSAADRKRLQQLLSRRGPGGTIASGSRTGGAFGQSSTKQTIHVHVHLNGREISDTVHRDDQRRGQRTAKARTGPNTGRGI